MSKHWDRGDLITRSEMLGLQPAGVLSATPATGVWLDIPVFVVEDCPQYLASYTAPGAQFHFADGPWPTPDGRHPWRERTCWEGNGCLMIQEPGEHVAIWHFWDGPQRDFLCWYLNIQTAFVRTPRGYQTQDLELDIIVFPDGTHTVKDEEVLDDRVSEGRYSSELVQWIRHYGDLLVQRLETHGPWWDLSWAAWEPNPDWIDPVLPTS